MERSEQIIEVNRRLVEMFGVPKQRAEDAVAALVGCILSQNTTDLQSGAAYDALVARFPTWAELRDARPQDLARVIKSCGLADAKTQYIQDALRFIEHERGEIRLDFLRDLPAADARKWLMQLRGVGPKTASIVLLFALKMPVMPVDTHVHRVTRRLGWISEKTSANQAHEILEGLTPPKLYYRLHINLIRLGREICRAPTPKCERCPLTDLCAYYQTQRK